MGITRRLGDASALPILVVAILILTALGPAFSMHPVVARQPSRTAPLDLPAMSLTPPQLADAGMPGYVLTGGQLSGARSLASIAGEWTDQVTNDDIQATLESFGLQRAYDAGLRLRQNPADIRSDAVRDLSVSLHEFTDANGATQALALLDQLSAAYQDVQRLQGAGPVTATALLVQTPTQDESVSQVLSVAFQVDRVIAVVEIIDYVQPAATTQDVEAIAAAFSQGINSGLAGDTPGLGNMALRLKEVEFDDLFEIRLDEYWRIAGQDFAADLEEADTFARRVAAAGDATDVYAFNQFVQDIESVDPSLPSQFAWVTRLYRFADDQAASTWLQAQQGQIEASYAGTDASAQELQAVESAPTVGDESVSVTYIEQSDFPGRIFRTFLRVGNRTADIYLSSFVDEPFPDTTIQALAGIQAQCLAVGCPDPILITNALAGTLPDVTPAPGTPVPSGQTSVDVAAVTLTPADLDAQQMAGYGVGFGQMSYPDEFIAAMVESRGLPEDQVRPAVESSGFLRRYDSQLYLPADPSSPSGTVGRVVASYVLEFSNEPGAASIFGFLEDESGNAFAGDIPMSAPIGDQSEATHETVLDPTTGQPFDQIDLTFQTGRFQAGVAIIDWQGQIVQLADVEKLAQQLFTRLQSASTGSGGNLSDLALRISGAAVEPNSDQYLLVAGQAIPQYGELAVDVQGRSNAAAAIAQTDEYEVLQFLAVGADLPDDNIWYTLHLLRFGDDSAATNWMAGVQGRVSSNTAFTNAVFSDGPAIGDESITYTLTTADGTTGYRSIAFRVGNDVALIDVSATGSTNPLLLLALADQQASCLQAVTCSNPFSVPPGLL